MDVNHGQVATLLVVHVPKAAGTTLRWIMDRQYPDKRMFKIGDDIPDERQRLAKMPEAEKRALRVVFGHMCWGWHEALAWGQGFQYITMLRNPLERVLSLYAYCHLPEHYLEQVTKGMDLRDYLTSGVSRTIDNGMVRQLCGEDQFLREPYADMVIPFGEVRRHHLEQAQDHLRRCAVVGLAERFETSLAMCRSVLGWRIPPYKNQNVTKWSRPKLEQLDGPTREALEERNELDQALYEFAEELFDARKAG